eukprot:4628686-Karenia_brevis.AAC.1
MKVRNWAVRGLINSIHFKKELQKRPERPLSDEEKVWLAIFTVFKEAGPHGEVTANTLIHKLKSQRQLTAYASHVKVSGVFEVMLEKKLLREIQVQSGNQLQWKSSADYQHIPSCRSGTRVTAPSVR